MGLTLWLSLQENQIWAHKALGPYGLRLIGWNTITKTIMTNKNFVVGIFVSGAAGAGALRANNQRIGDNNYAYAVQEQKNKSNEAWTNYHDSTNNCHPDDHRGRTVAAESLSRKLQVIDKPLKREDFNYSTYESVKKHLDGVLDTSKKVVDLASDLKKK